MSFFGRIFSNMRTVACAILDVVGIAAGVISRVIPMPAWAKTTLKVVSVAAPVASATIAVASIISDNKDYDKAKTMTEKALEIKDNKTDDSEILSLVDDDYQEAIQNKADEIRGISGKSRRRNRKGEKRSGMNPHVKPYKEVFDKLVEDNKLTPCDVIASGGCFVRSSVL